MKSIVLHTFILFSLFAGAQVKHGVYEQSPVITDNFGTVFFSDLIIHSDGTFVYEHRESSCLLWYDLKGNWQERGDTLVLTDTTECINQLKGESKMLPRETRFLIKERGLIFEKQIFKTIGYFPEHEINFCDYTLKEVAD